MDECVSCQKTTTAEQQAMACDICEGWEHVSCLRQCDKLSGELYEALQGCRSKALLYICTRCRKRGSINKRLHEHEVESARAQEQRLASAQADEQLHALVSELRDDKRALRAKVESLEAEIRELRAQLPNPIRVTSDTQAPITRVEESSEHHHERDEDHSLPPASVTVQIGGHESSEGSESATDSDNSQQSHSHRQTPRTKRDPHPPGFRTLLQRVDKFSGRQGGDDFEVWLTDFEEATAHCGWQDKQRMKWFSWFLSGPAKATWQRTLKDQDKASWQSIVKIYRGQYGVHLDPRIAYQKCQELQYNQFGSAQGLLDAMRDYQRMAPEKLTDATLESILWNKVPIALQQELKEIPDGSVQELLQKLLRAEATLRERERRSKETRQLTSRQDMATPPRFQSSGQGRNSNSTNAVGRSGNSATNPQQGAEMSIKSVKCYNCHKKGHLAKDCAEPKTKKTQFTRRIATESPNNAPAPDPWLRTVTAESDPPPGKASTAARGPTYKVDITVDGVKTRALLDHGAQVSLARRQLLPVIKEGNNWTVEQCQNRNLKMEGQPQGAGGHSLGAEGMVALQVTIENTGVSQRVPCYILDSAKPIWKGELKDCGLVIGTNALADLGFHIVDAQGCEVTAEEDISPTHETEPKSEKTKEQEDKDNNTEEAANNETEPSQVLEVGLTHDLHLASQQTRVATVRLMKTYQKEENEAGPIGVVTPNESVLASKQCDFTEGYWTGESTFCIPVTNWGGETVVVPKDSKIGHVELVTLVEPEDALWEDDQTVTVARVNSGGISSERRRELESRLAIGTGCSAEERKALIQLMIQKNSVFALSEKELGQTDQVEHSIALNDSTPIRTTPRRLPYALRSELEGELQKLLDIGCIEPSSSSFASGLVLVRKKDGGLRVCVDYRGINKKTIPDCYPIPRIDDLIDTVGRCHGKIFTTLDLMKGYHQIKMASESKEKTAFTCHLGLFQYRRMPFGLTNAPATFQRLMNKLFCGPKWNFLFVYLDDLLIVSQSFQEHLEHVEQVLKQLEDAGLRLRPEKCSFAQASVEYLGHTLSPEGVRPNDNKVKAVKEFPQPTCCKEVKSFLGLINFYRRHLPNLAAITRPLTALTRRDKETGTPVPFVSDRQCESAFQEVKRMLVSAPLLHPPDLTKPFYLWTDASEKGFGALLEQEDSDGRRHPVAYASRQTNPAEAKYAPTELEVAALVYAVEHFEVYLLGSQFTVYTDHQSLVSAFITHMKSQSRGLLARWYLRIARFLPKMQLEYKPGAANVVADTLSRAPVPTKEDKVSVLCVQDQQEEPLLKSVREQQRQDGVLSDLISYLQSKELPSDEQAAGRVLKMNKRGFLIVSGVLYYEGDGTGGRRLVVPSHLQQKLLDEQHDGVFAGHFAYKKMYQRMKKYYYWEGMSGDICKKCESCVDCASVQGQGFKGTPPLVSIPVGGPFECVGMDFVEFDKSAAGNQYALVFQDYLTKWPEVYAVDNRRAETVAECLVDLIWRHGVPRRIIHDRAAEFLAEVLQETAHIMGISQLPTSGGHPQTNGLVERFNRTLKQMLCKLVNNKGRNWDQLLGGVLFAYRSTPHQSTGEAPFFLLYGRQPNLPTALDLTVPMPRFPVVESAYGLALEKELKEARAVAKRNIEAAQRRQKSYYDRGVKDNGLSVGDLVMLKVQPKYKLDRRYKGPFVIKSLTDTNAVIQSRGDPNSEELNVSRQRLSKCGGAMSNATPWLGQSGKLRKRRVVKKPTLPDEDAAPLDSSLPPKTVVTRHGRQVRRPARFTPSDTPEGLSLKGGGSCEAKRVESRELRESHASRPPRSVTS